MDAATLGRTRRSLHAVAEWVVAPARQGLDGRIGLTPTPGGFGAAHVRVDGTDLVVGDDRRALTTLADAARFAGVEPGRPLGVYEEVSAWQPDEPLAIAPDAAAALAGWFALGAALLRPIGGEPTLWPEHFDLAVTVDEVNVGVSPGDDDHPLPYAYVGPWSVPAGPFWNEPFGASIPWAGPDVVLAFFRAGLAQAAP